MAQPAIRMNDVGKRYRHGLSRESYSTLRDSIASGVKRLVRRRGQRRPSGSADSFWALSDVSMDVPRGTALALIGGNGAGKSTLLKVIARVTEPTTGYLQLRGRVGSLLEVGTGFHPELSGRENVLLNGAILGMKRWEILKKFSEIVAFAEVEPFIDMAVKHYSSGMYLRLAFAVAAHLEPEILLVDEVLAVGDAAFQTRCLGKMGDVAREGRTVIFVSHNIDAVQRLCSHAVLLEKGRVAAYGATGAVVSRYLSQESQRPAPETVIDLSASKRSGSGDARFVSVRYGSGNPRVGGKAYPNGPLAFTLEIESNAERSVGSVSIFILEQYGLKVINADTVLIGRSVSLRTGRNRLRLLMRALHLTPGLYRVGFWLADPIQAQADGGQYDHIESAFEIEVVNADASVSYETTGVVALVTCEFEVDELR